MSTIINSTHTVEMRFASSAQNGVTVTSTGTVSTTEAVALYGEKTVAAWRFTNYGKVRGARYGIQTFKGGDVTNGGASATKASIYGKRAGVYIGAGAGTVLNDGTISASSSEASYGVRLRTGGSVSNGADSGTALIEGSTEGVLIQTATGTLANDGTIEASAVGGIGALLAKGGNVTNGAGNNAATIAGVAVGVSILGTGNVVNSGTISASHGVGVYRTGSGSVVNGSTAATLALISGTVNGVQLKGSGDQPVNQVTNFATITGGTTGVELDLGGSVINGSAQDVHARITGGDYGVSISSPGTVVNYGTIKGTKAVKAGTVFPHPSPIPTHTAYGGYGVVLQKGGALYNGSATDTRATISGAFIGVKLHGANANVHNYGTVTGGVVGIYNYLGGLLVNGSNSDTSALIAGGQLGFRNTYPGATIQNFGTFASSLGSAVNIAAGGHLGASAGTFVNGGAGDTVALATGYLDGVTTVSGGLVENYGTIIGSTLIGAYVTAGGTLTNGSAGDTAALISGDTVGAAIKGEFQLGNRTLVNSLINDGTITGSVTGAALFTGGVLLNGAASANAALIAAGSGAGVQIGDTGTVLNYGTITSTSGAGLYATLGGVFSNGAAGLISGRTYGIDGEGAAATSITNSGTILASHGVGALLNLGGALTNGAPADAAALIRGSSEGVELDGPANVARVLTNYGTITGATGVYCSPQAQATVVNAGTIIGTGGTALQFGVNADRLVLDPGAVFVGAVDGGIVADNTVELAIGDGSAGRIGGFGGSITNFAIITVDSAADWSLTGSNAIATLDNAGTLQVAANASLDVTAAVGHQSTGKFQIGNNATLEVAAMAGSGGSIQFLNIGAATLAVDNALLFGAQIGGTAYSGALLQGFAASDAIDLKGVASAGAGLAFNSSSGLLQVAAAGAPLATLAFDTATLGAGSFHAGNDGHGFLLITRS